MDEVVSPREHHQDPLGQILRMQVDIRPVEPASECGRDVDITADEVHEPIHDPTAALELMGVSEMRETAGTMRKAQAMIPFPKHFRQIFFSRCYYDTKERKLTDKRSFLEGWA